MYLGANAGENKIALYRAELPRYTYIYDTKAPGVVITRLCRLSRYNKESLCLKPTSLQLSVAISTRWAAGSFSDFYGTRQIGPVTNDFSCSDNAMHRPQC